MGDTTLHAFLQQLSARELGDGGWDRGMLVPGAWDGAGAREGMERFLLSYRSCQCTEEVARLGLTDPLDEVWLYRNGREASGGPC